VKNLIKYFLYLGATGFGGPLVLIQQMREHYVDQEKSISAAEFDQAFALIKAMPGPVAFQMATFLGQRFLGFWGATAAGFCLLLPAFIMMVLFGYYYDSFVHNPYVAPVLDGLLYSASAVILMSLKNLINVNKKNSLFWVFVAINLFLSWYHVLPEPALILIFGVLAVLYKHFTKTPQMLFSVPFFFIDYSKLFELFKICAYAGAFVFGTGFALLPALKTSMVDVHNLVSIKQFNDAVVFGQMTPGPITITASFLGYQISGFVGALVATIGIFLLPFIHMTTWFPKAIDWLGRQKWITEFIMGATAAVVAGILTTVVHMNAESFAKPIFWLIAVSSLAVIYFRSKTSVLLLFVIAGTVNLLKTIYLL
jgi:chromate transporter